MAEINNIYIKSVNWVGDVIMSTPALSRIRRKFPDARIVISARPWVAALLEDNPDIDELWLEGTKRELIAKIRQRKFDLGFSFPNSFGTARLMYKGGIKRRIGYARDLRSFMLTDAVPCTKEIRRVHEVEYYINLLKPIMEIDDQPRQLILPVNETARGSVNQKLLNAGIQQSDKIVGINPGAYAGTAKRWLPERYAETADRLAEKLNGKIVLTGIANEREVCEYIASLCKHPVTIMAGECNLKEAIALIDRFFIMATNDSGGMHIAAARKVPMVAVIGSTDWRTTYPYSDNAKIFRKPTPCAPCLLRECPIDHRCMTKITTDEIVETAMEVVQL